MRRLLVAIIAVSALIVAACDWDGIIVVPEDGAIVSTSTVTAQGVVQHNLGGTLRVNGLVTAYGSDGSWSREVPVDPGSHVTPIDVRYDAPSGRVFRQRIAVVRGDSIPSGSYSPDGVGLQFTNAGLAGLGPVMKDLAGGAFDVGALLMSQNPIINEPNAFLGFDVVGNAYEAGLASVDIATSASPAGVRADIDLADLYVGVDLTLSGLWTMNCGLEIQIPHTAIAATFDLEPNPSNPSFVEVHMVGAPSVTTSNVNYEFIWGVCDADTFLIGDIVNLIAGPMIQDMVADGFSSSLGGPSSPLSAALEEALAEISIAGEVGNAIGVNLDAPMTAITEDASGVTLRADANFFATEGTGPSDCQPDPHAPDLASTYDIPGAFPTLNGLTPDGTPYGLALAISVSAFNQLLGAMTECGLINQEITEIPFGPSTLPVTAGLLAAFDPGFGSLPPSTPLVIRVRPTVAPFITTDAGPGGEPGELMLANLMIDIYDPAATKYGYYWLDNLVTLAIDAPLGFDLAYDEAAGQLVPSITPPDPSHVQARVIYNNFLNLNEANLEALFPNLFPLMADGLGDTFSSFPLPAFLGLELEVLDTARDAGYFILYANLNNIPQTRIENPVLTNLSTANGAVDSCCFNSHEWRHRIRPQFSSQALNVAYKSVIGADACCFVDNASRSATASYRLTFDVIPEHGETWNLDIGHHVEGAHTRVKDQGGWARTQFTTPIYGWVRVGSGPWQSFSFNANPSQLPKGQTTTQLPFSGQNSISLQGDTPQTVTVEFSHGQYALSESYSGWDFWNNAAGIEGAIRMGANDTLTNGFDAGGYPGVGNRNILTDGWFASVALSAQ